MELGLTAIIALIVIYILSSIPLWLAVKFLGGDGGLIKVIIVNIKAAEKLSLMIIFSFENWAVTFSIERCTPLTANWESRI